MIEDQKLPDEVMLSTAGGFGAQRIAVIEQQLLTTARIESIIDKLDLYPDAEDLSSAALAEDFRSNVLIEMVDSEVIDPRTGRAMEATIAFILGFFDGEPETSRIVTEELTKLFLEENVRSRSATVASISEFLTGEAAELAEELSRREAELAAFKEANAGALPEFYQYNLSALERSEQQLLEIERRIQDAEQRVIQLSAELSQISPYSATTLPSGEVVMSDEERFRALMLEYKRKSDIYSDAHPDLVRLKREIESLRSSLGVTGDGSSDDLLYKDPAANNPAYLLISTQLESARSEAKSLSDQRRALNATREKFDELVRRSPQVEREYQAVVRDYESASEDYRDLRSKQGLAEIAKSAEEGSASGQFTLIEPANFPRYPESPNRVAVLTLGLILAVVAGIAAVMLAEIVDVSLRGPRSIARIVGAPPLVVIPYLDNTIDRVNADKRRKAAIVGTILLISVLALYINFVIKPLG
jgi:uncharacterized protein involved in exopolysaccharide biosynthesis